MAPRVFSKDYLLDKLDELWALRENMALELQWSYECCLDHLIKKVTRHMIELREAEKQRQQYEFVYTTCLQNLETSQENLDVLKGTIQYLCEQSPIDHPSTRAHYRNVVYNFQPQEEGLLKVQAHINAWI